MATTARLDHALVLATGILLSTSALADIITPGNLRYAVYSHTAAELFWDRASTDAAYVSGYEITRNGEVFDTRDGLSLFISDLHRSISFLVRGFMSHCGPLAKPFNAANCQIYCPFPVPFKLKHPLDT